MVWPAIPLFCSPSQSMHSLVAGQAQHTAALEQLSHAVDLAPNEPLPCLLLGIAYLAAAMSRKTPDRDRAVLLAFTSLHVGTSVSLSVGPTPSSWNRGADQCWFCDCKSPGQSIFCLSLRYFDACLAWLHGCWCIQHSQAASMHGAVHSPQDCRKYL